jgi:hypothetical protein
MGARLGFADVLLSKLADVPPPVALGWQGRPIASPAWVHRLEPLRVVTAQVLHSRYPHPASAAPAAGGIPVGASSNSSRSGTRRRRSQREQVGIALLNRLGSQLLPSATDDEVRRAYRQLVRAFHPDLHHGADAATLAAQGRKLRAAIRAWDVFQGRTNGN